MSKNFGYANKSGSSKDWSECDPYDDDEIKAIKDPEGGSEISMPPAIPSPFARIDLVKTAFRNIVKSPTLKAHTEKGVVQASKNDEKLVSDCLDLAELLFDSDSIPNELKIIPWDKDVELAKLKAASDKHRRFAETLELYLDQDKKAYNFDLLRRLYLIEYNYKIIGCTSPSTLFFATANDLSHAQMKLTGNDILFDEKYAPLYGRDAEFQKYFYLLFNTHPILKKRMKEFGTYLDENKKLISDPKLLREINEIERGNPEELREQYNTVYEELNTGPTGSEVEVFGIGLRKRKSENVVKHISDNSDFRINSIKIPADNKPLVLQNDFSQNWIYAKDKWHGFKVPYVESNDVKSRRLPEINIPYPFLTVSDFLEPYLIRLVYPVNSDKFFDGNLKNDIVGGDLSKGYILPLKKEFFDYFDAGDLIGSAAGKPRLSLNQNVGGAVKVTLKIPVAKAGEYIALERTYYKPDDEQPRRADEENNKGAIVEHQVGLTLFPFIKTGDPNIKPFYRVQLVDRDFVGQFKGNDYSLTFYSDKSLVNDSDDAPENDSDKSPEKLPIVDDRPKIRSLKNYNGDATSKYYILENEFDFIQINSGFASGIIIPKWKPFHQGNKEFSFAVDFGTTNTHVEYRVDDVLPKPFDIGAGDVQIATLYDPDKTSELFGDSSAIAIRELIEHEFVPFHLGKNDGKYNYKFPQRTVLSEGNSLDLDKPASSLADFNIPFTYEKKTEKSRIQSNLKWAKKDKHNRRRVEVFLEELIMLLRNKVLLNGGDLSKTKLIWFYPSSMNNRRIGELKDVWNNFFKQYFSKGGATIEILESMAPFFFFKADSKLQGGAFKPVVAIDIGGGTTDIVVFQSKPQQPNAPILLTSFKFAANAIFGDGFSEFGTNSNGLVNKYYPIISNLLEKNKVKLVELSGVLSSIKEKSKNEDINAFFFSIEENPRVTGDNKKMFSYNSMLADDEHLGIIFLYFYAAIIYHIARLMKDKNIEPPKNLVFSGTGSKILKIITTDLNILAQFSIKIFDQVYERELTEGLKISTEDTPKEVTCKGGLLADPKELQKVSVSDIKAVLTGRKNNGGEKLHYKDLDESVKNEITDFVREFNRIFIELHSQFKFTDNFNVSKESLDIFRDEFSKDLPDNLEEGLQYTKKLDEVTDESDEIAETLFFYPIIGTIHRVARILSVIENR